MSKATASFATGTFAKMRASSLHGTIYRRTMLLRWKRHGCGLLMGAGNTAEHRIERCCVVRGRASSFERDWRGRRRMRETDVRVKFPTGEEH